MLGNIKLKTINKHNLRVITEQSVQTHQKVKFVEIIQTAQIMNMKEGYKNRNKK